MINDPDANHSRRSPRLALAAAVLLLFAARLEGANPPTQADLPPQPKFFFAGKSFDASRVRIIAVEEKDAAANSEKMAPILFSEELEKRTKIKLTRWTEWPADETLPVIAIASRD
ncbi:hypothetical protein HYR69_04205, partial [Candidatus Sumerlaeota bacterium]|nr:hypothetical protein [Candidatus Sumerlaeota bacterium]